MSYQGAHSGAEVDDAVGVTKGAGTGFVAKTGTGSGEKRTLTGSDRVTVSNGDGSSGDPTFDFTQAVIDSLSNADTAFGWGDHAKAGYLLSSSYTASDVKTKYESNADTNAFTDSEKSKLGNALVEGGEITRYSETVATGDSTLDRADGGIQTFTMTANITLSVTIADGESLTFHLSGGDTYSVTWPTMTWVGGSAPTLTAADVIEFWKVGSTLYGAYVGSVA